MDLSRSITFLPRIFCVSLSLICNITSWEVDNESVDSSTSFRDALIALTSKREGDKEGDSAMEGGGKRQSWDR